MRPIGFILVGYPLLSNLCSVNQRHWLLRAIVTGSTGDARWFTIRRWQGVLGDLATRRDGANAIAIQLGKPEVAIWPRRDPFRFAVGIGQGVLGDLTTGGDLADAVAIDGIELGKPEALRAIPTRSRGDVFRLALGMRQGIFGERAAGGDHANIVAIALGKPEVAIRATGDAYGLTLWGRDRVLGDGASHQGSIVYGAGEMVTDRQLRRLLDGEAA